jgi:hypothetical protein
MQQAPTNNSQMRTAAIVTIVVIIGLLLLGRFVTGMMDNNNTPTTSDTIDNTNNTNSNTTLNPQNNTTNNSNNVDTSNLGPVVAAQNVDRDNCAVDATTSFDDNDPIYVVLEDSQLARGTTMFARMYRNGTAVEDTSELTAEQDYNNTCVSFVFEPTDNAEVWDEGNYEVEFYINGNAYQSTSFEIR